MKKAFFILFLITGINISAQTVGGGLLLGFPQGEFKEKVTNTGYGAQIQGTLFTPTKANPFTIGLNFSFIVYGSETNSRPLSETIPDVWVDVNTSNNLVSFHVLFQFSHLETDIRPYAECLFGGAYLYTTTKVESQYSDQDVFESTNFDAFTWNYGFGGGLLFKIKSGLGIGSDLFLDLKTRYMFGTEAEYLKKGSIQIVSGKAVYDVQKSKTDLLTVQAGIMVSF